MLTTDRLRRLKFRAWHRGTREADYMIGCFFDRYHTTWTEAEIDLFERLVEEEDVDINGLGAGHAVGPCRICRADDRRDDAARLCRNSALILSQTMPDLARILSASTPLTLSSVARGAQPLVLADLARAAKGRAVFIAADEAAMRSVVETAAFFAPELDVIEFPAWDCLPFDRASPALSVSARRLAALSRLQVKQTAPQLLVTTVTAVLQRVLTPFRIRESTRVLKAGMEIGRDSLIALLQRQGYSRADTVIDAGEYAVRGGVFDLYPSGLDHGLRLDFFGDELETLRLFDPNTQRSVQPVDSHLLIPASEALLDEASIKRFPQPLSRDFRRQCHR